MSHSKPKVVTTKPQPPPPAQPQPRPPPPKEGKVRVVSQEKLLSPTVLSNNVNQPKKTLNPSFPFNVSINVIYKYFFGVKD